MSRLISFSVLATVLLMPQIAVAQHYRWANLEQIQSGQKVVVIDQQMKNVTGTFVRVSENDLTIKKKDKEITMDRDSVYRVTSTPQHRGRNTLIGLGVGAATGAIWGASVPAEDMTPAQTGSIMAGALGGIGAGVGALIAPAKTFYRADKVNKAANSTTSYKDQAPASSTR